MVKIIKSRLDDYIVEKGLFESKSQAQGAILAGKVKVDGKILTKAGFQVCVEKMPEIQIESMPYVSRGGFKLEKGIKEFNINLQNKICIDAGASTGGFTDCMLQNGALKVYAVDVGYGQIAWKLRNNSRVVVIERTNIRNASPEDIYKEFFLQQSQHISLTEFEPGNLGDINKLANDELKKIRKIAKKYYQEHIQGQSVDHPKLGKIIFTGKGIDKTLADSVDTKIIQAVPKLINIVKSSKYENSKIDYKNNNGNKYHYLKGSLCINNELFNYRITILEDSEGNKYYNLNDQSYNDKYYKSSEPSMQSLEPEDSIIITNFGRDLNPNNENINNFAEFCSIDVSFISLTKILGNIKNLMSLEKQEIIALIKPQFEAGKELVPKSGVIKDKNIHINIIKNIADFAFNIGFYPINLTFSPIQGPAGNIEYLIYLKNNSEYNKTEFEKYIYEIVEKAHEYFNQNKITK